MAGVVSAHQHSYPHQNSLVLVYGKNLRDTSEGMGPNGGNSGYRSHMGVSRKGKKQQR